MDFFYTLEYLFMLQKGIDIMFHPKKSKATIGQHLINYLFLAGNFSFKRRNFLSCTLALVPF